MHAHYVNAPNGDLSGVIPFCSDSCHVEYDGKHDLPYEGWNGALEGSDSNEYCANCGVICSCGKEACEDQRDNVIVNRFVTAEGEMCSHGNWIQLPASMIGQ